MLSAAMAGALAALAFAGSARAQVVDACGPLDTDGRVTCGGGANPYASGIKYQPATPIDLTVVLDSDLAVERSDGDGAHASIDLRTSGAGSITVDAREGSSIVTDGDGQRGLVVVSGAGDVTVTAPRIETYGASARALLAQSTGGGDVRIVAPAEISTYGDDSRAVQAITTGHAEVTVTDVHTWGYQSEGIAVNAGSADVTVTGDITTQGIQAYGVYLRAAAGLANLSVTGSVKGYNGAGVGVDARGQTGVRVTGGGVVEANGVRTNAINATAVTGDVVIDLSRVALTGREQLAVNAVAMDGDIDINIDEFYLDASRSFGITAIGNGRASVTTQSMTITGIGANTGIVARAKDVDVTVGDVFIDGIRAQAVEVEATHTANVTINGDILSNVYGQAIENMITVYGGDTRDEDAPPIGEVTVTLNGTITTTGQNTSGIRAESNGWAVVQGGGSITTQGNVSYGVKAYGSTGQSVELGQIDTAGENSHAVKVISLGHTDLSLDHIATAGRGAQGVWAYRSGSIDAFVGDISTTGDRAGAFYVVNDDHAELGADHISTTGFASSAITIARSRSAGVTVGDLRVSGAVATGINIYNVGDVRISAGSVDTEGDSSEGIAVLADGDVAIDVATGETLGVASGLVKVYADGAVTLNAGSLKTSGPVATAVNLTGGDIDLEVAEIKTSGNRSAGVWLTASGDALASVGSLETVGARSSGLIVSAGGGAAIEVADVRTNGSLSSAVDVSAGGAVVGVGSATTNGALADGVRVTTSGDQLIVAEEVTTYGSGARGIVAQSTGGDVTVVAGSLYAGGADSRGMVVTGAGGVSVAVGSSSVSGDFSRAVEVTAGGNAELTVGDLNVSGEESRGLLVNAGENALVTLVGSIEGSVDHPADETPVVGPDGRVQSPVKAIVEVNAEGVAGVDHQGVIVTTGALEGGIGVRGQVGAVVTGNGFVWTEGLGATGVYAAAASGVALVDAEETEIVTFGDDALGVHARSYGSAGASVGSVGTSGVRAIGVLVEGGESAIASVGSVDTTGEGAHGVVAHTYGAAMAAAGSITVTGSGALAMDVASYSQGDAIAAAGQVHVSDGRGVSALARDGLAAVTVGDLVQASTLGGGAIHASGLQGALVSFDTVESRGDGISNAVGAFSNSGDILVEGGSLLALGEGRSGLAALSESGNVTVSVESIVSSGAALRAESYYGSVDVTLGVVKAGAEGWPAINAMGSTATVRVGSVETTGAGDADVRSAAVNVVAVDGTARVEVGSVSAIGDNRLGIAVGATKTADIVVTGAVLATDEAVQIGANERASLVNSGSIRSERNVAVRAFGGPLTLTNTGLIDGALVLGDGADMIINSGTLRLTGVTRLGAGDDVLRNEGDVVLAGTLDTGAGADRFVNSGTMRLGDGPAGIAAMRPAAVAAQAPASRTIAGLETFENRGLIDLRNGTLGDQLSLAGAFVGSDDSTLAVDMAADGSSADSLVITGAATGRTMIVVNPVGEGALVAATPIITVGAGSSPTAFEIDPASLNQGLFAFGMTFDAATGKILVASTPSASAYQLMKVAEGAQTLWQDGADVVADHLASGDEGGRGVWASASIGHGQRQEQRTLSVLGVSQTADLGYRQEVTSGQFGVDLGEGGLTFGLTAGFANADMRFSDTADEVRNEALNLGAYVRFETGPYFVSALAKYDWYDLDVRLASAAARAEADGGGAGLAVQGGARFGSDAFSIQPVIGVSLSRVKLDNLALPLSVDFEDRVGGRANAGVRLASRRDLDSGARLALSLQLDYVDPFGGDDATRFTTGATSIAVADQAIGSHGRGQIGASLTQGRITAFFEAEARVSDDYKGGAGRAGFRIGF